MDIDLTTLTGKQLKEFYTKANEELKKALLNGLSWQEVKAKRDIVIEIAKELHKKEESVNSSED
jgi:hypothetical protein